MMQPVLLYILLVLVAILAIGIAVAFLIKGINNPNSRQRLYPRRKAKISRRIRRQIEDIIRTYDDQWEEPPGDDDAVDFLDK